MRCVVLVLALGSVACLATEGVYLKVRTSEPGPPTTLAVAPAFAPVDPSPRRMVPVSVPPFTSGQLGARRASPPGNTVPPAVLELDLGAYFAPWDEAGFVLWNLDANTILRHDGRRCARRFSPCSTFKIANALIGLETGAIPDEDFVLTWDGVNRDRPINNRDHNLRTALMHSVVWYYQELARRVGEVRMRQHVAALRYGNMDTSSGLTTFWLDGSLAISADEQVEFLRKLATGELPVSQRAADSVRRMLVLSASDGVVYRGKTGSGRGSGERADQGWFVGWLEGPGGTHVFACNIQGRGAAGFKAREAVERLLRDRGLLSTS